MQDGSGSDLYEEEMQHSDGLSDLDHVRAVILLICYSFVQLAVKTIGF